MTPNIIIRLDLLIKYYQDFKKLSNTNLDKYILFCEQMLKSFIEKKHSFGGKVAKYDLIKKLPEYKSLHSDTEIYLKKIHDFKIMKVNILLEEISTLMQQIIVRTQYLLEMDVTLHKKKMDNVLKQLPKSKKKNNLLTPNFFKKSKRDKTLLTPSFFKSKF